MKKSLNKLVMTALLIISVGTVVGMEPSEYNALKVLKINVYVENMAQSMLGGGYDIIVKPELSYGEVVDLSKAYIMPKEPKEQKVAFEGQVYLMPLEEIDDILTSGAWAFDWKSNKNYLAMVKKEAIKNKYKNAKVYLSVMSGTGGYYITGHRWLTSADINVPKISPKEPEKLMPEVKGFEQLPSELQGIIKGSLGQDYANKVIAICNADYTKVKAQGLIDLRHNLIEGVKPLFGKIKPKATPGTYEIKMTEDEIKTKIDMLYKKLQDWKNRGLVLSQK